VFTNKSKFILQTKEFLMSGNSQFDVEKYRKMTRQEWQKAAAGWHKWIPLISELSRQETNQMLDLANVQSGYRVLDIAAGDGDQSIMAGQRVGPQGHVLATDISSNLLEYAAAAAKEAGLSNLETRVMDGENLELGDATFDAVICRHGLMLMPDVDKAMNEIYRVLKSGGWFSAVVFSTPDKNPWISIPAMIAMQHAELPPPEPGMPGLFSLSAPGLLEGKFKTAGFQDIKGRSSTVTIQLDSATECVGFLQDIAGALHTILSNLSAEDQKNAWSELMGLCHQKRP
jgi:ubiquinone/menaquinone biosynthesis C-methylase UbiE